MPRESIIMPLDADHISVDRIDYEASYIWQRPSIESTIFDIGYSREGSFNEGYLCLHLALAIQLQDDIGDSVISAGISLTGEFYPRVNEYSKDATLEDIEEWLGANAILQVYSKAAFILEQRINDSPVEHISLPTINPYVVWRDGEISDDGFWEKAYNGKLYQAFLRQSIKNYTSEDNEEISVAVTDAIKKSAGAYADLTDAWVLDDHGEQVLREPFRTKLAKAKLLATQAWRDTLLDYLAEETQYTYDDLKIALLRHSAREGDRSAVVNDFILEALCGNLH